MKQTSGEKKRRGKYPRSGFPHVVSRFALLGRESRKARVWPRSLSFLNLDAGNLNKGSPSRICISGVPQKPSVPSEGNEGEHRFCVAALGRDMRNSAGYTLVCMCVCMLCICVEHLNYAACRQQSV